MGDPAQRLASAGKVAIPALRPRTDPAAPASTIGKSRRTTNACVECKSKKVKCSGRKPTCDHCEQCQVPCIYAASRRERNKKVTKRGDRLLQLLRDASSQTSLPAHILDELNALESEVVDDGESFSSPITATASKRRDGSPASKGNEKRRRLDSTVLQTRGEADVSADVGSEESVDLTSEDFNRSGAAKATGFIGKHSEIAWAQRLARVQTEGMSKHQDDKPHGTAGMGEQAGVNRVAAMKSRHTPENDWNDSISDYSYHLDGPKTLKLDHVEEDELPPTEVANLLVDCYMNNAHNFLPMLIKPDFSTQFQSCIHSRSPDRAPATWRAMLNLVFAIGAKFSHLVGAPWRGDDRDHLVYHTRALQLSPINETTMVVSDLQRIQIVGLMSFYYLIIGHVSRSWIMLGLVCRQAAALGLHLRPLAPSLGAASREKRTRVWWSLYYLEYLTCEITGRPTMINHQFCSVPVIAPVEEEALVSRSGNRQLEAWNNSQGETAAESKNNSFLYDLEATPNPTNHFRSRVQLAIIAQKIFTNLYSAATVSKTWQRAQEDIVALGQEVDQWYRTLPREFQFTLELGKSDEAFTRERVILGFCYYSAKMLLNRPCLCRIDKRIQNQGGKSKNMDSDQARQCVMAARSISDLLPGEDGQTPDVLWLYNNGPWWCIVHYFMQAITVLMLELAIEERSILDMKSHRSDITKIAGKIARWLSAMAATGNPTAVAACKQVRVQFEGFKPFKDLDTSELLRSVHYGEGIVERDSHTKPQTHLRKTASQALPTRWQPGGAEGIKQPFPADEHYSADVGAFASSEQHTEPHQHGKQQDEPMHSSSPWAQFMSEPLQFKEPWQVGDGFDWNAAFFHSPYDVFNPFAATVPAAVQATEEARDGVGIIDPS